MTDTTLDHAESEALPLQSGPKLATPWARFWARSLDMSVYMALAGAGVAVLLALFWRHVSSSTRPASQGPSSARSLQF